MSNKERTAKLLIPNRTWCKTHHRGEGGDPCGFCEHDSQTFAQHLADAGLLAPDLPEPQEHGGKLVWPITGLDGWAVSLHDGWIRIADKYGATMCVDTELAYGFARALLAATKHAGEQQETKGEGE